MCVFVCISNRSRFILFENVYLCFDVENHRSLPLLINALKTYFNYSVNNNNIPFCL